MNAPRASAKGRGFLGALAGLGLLFAAAAPLCAQETYTQAFDAPVGGLPADWKRAEGFQPALGVAEIATSTDRAWLRQQRTDGPKGNSFIYFDGNFGSVQDGLLSDFTATVTFMAAGGMDGDGRGLMVRAGAKRTGYFVFIADGRLKISLNPTDATTGRGAVLAMSEDKFGKLMPGVEYRFTVTAKGQTITASVHAWDDTTSSFDTLVAEVSAEDGALGSGFFGIRSAFTSDGRSTFWRDLTITAAPESSAAAATGPAQRLCLLRHAP